MTSEERAREIFAYQAREDGLSSWADAIQRDDIAPSTKTSLRAIVRAIEEEREAAAKIVYDMWRELKPDGNSIPVDMLHSLAAAIRQRGEA